MRRKAVLIFAVIGCVLAGGSFLFKHSGSSASPVSIGDDLSSYTQAIIDIDQRNKELHGYESHLDDPLFKIIYLDNLKNTNNYVKFLSSPEHTLEQRWVSILTMSNFDRVGYIKFLRIVIDLADRKLISPLELQRAAFPGEEFSEEPLIDYKDPEMRAVLMTLRTRQERDTQDRDAFGVRFIDSVLSGELQEKLTRSYYYFPFILKNPPEPPGFDMSGFDNLPGFAEKVIATDKALDRLVASRTLLDFDPFNRLAAEADRYAGDCLAFLERHDDIRQQRLVAIFAMHRLSLNAKIRFLDGMFALYSRGLVSNFEIQVAIYPGDEFEDNLFDNFCAKEAQDLFSKIKSHPEIGLDPLLRDLMDGRDPDHYAWRRRIFNVVTTLTKQFGIPLSW